jgi:polysaccharide biosynthesis protein PslH
MKILQLCKKFPYPLKDGESIAVTYLSKALASKGCEITLLAMNTTKHFVDPESIPESFNHYKEIVFTSLDNRVKPFNALLNLFSDKSYHVSRFVSKEFELKLIELLQNNSFDVIQLETLYLASYIDVIREHSDAIIALRAHNIEFEIWERITENTTFPVKKWYLSHLTKKLKKFELEKLNDYDYIISVSERDLKKFKQLGYKNGAMASPIGLEVENYKLLDKMPMSNSICFIGALDWLPNIEGLNWFLKQVWPVLYQENPDLSFHVAGRNTPENLLTLNMPGVKIHGEVPDAVEFIGNYQMMVVPLFSGSGMRVKILEGMALGKPIVTTSLGKEGINANHDEHLIVADDASAFIKEIKNLLQSKDRIGEMGKAARLFVEDFYDHSAIAQKLMKRYEELQSTYRKNTTQISL